MIISITPRPLSTQSTSPPINELALNHNQWLIRPSVYAEIYLNLVSSEQRPSIALIAGWAENVERYCAFRSQQLQDINNDHACIAGATSKNTKGQGVHQRPGQEEGDIT